MVFQPTSPLRTFHRTSARTTSGQHQAASSSAQTMPSKKTSHTLGKLRLKKQASRSPVDKSIISGPSPIPTMTFTNNETSQGEDEVVAQLPTIPETVEGSERTVRMVTRGSIRSTHSSPTDPAYVPNQSANGGHLLGFRSPAKLRQLPHALESQSEDIARHSFFDTSSESGEDEPVIARAQSVRISKPSIVQRAHHQEEVSMHYDTPGDTTDHSTSPLNTRLSKMTGTTVIDTGSEQSEQERGGPQEALSALEGFDVIDYESGRPIDTQAPLRSASGLRMHPILNSGVENIQPITSPSVIQRSMTNRKVKIRPADLIVTHPRHSARAFRESIVSTPYPVLDDCDEKMDEDDIEGDENLTALPQKSSTVRSARFDGDRFPSPDRPETLFLDLSLAGHPAVSTTLEIKISDKGVFDDEMLFRQIRQTYRKKLLGVSRLPFCLIRSFSHATVPPSLQYDFRTKEFVKHLDNPRLGRKRKTWIIWLRHHSNQQSSLQDHRPDSSKRPLSASLKTADRRLSVHSDSTSTFNFPFLPWLTLPRIPFLSKEATTTLPDTSHHMSPGFKLEGGSPAIKFELHHRFSFWALAFLYFWIMLWSISAVVIWVVFGVPGSRPGDDTATTSSMGLTSGMPWNAAAQTRVLTGLVLGMTVALLGSMIELGLIAGAYILL